MQRAFLLGKVKATYEESVLSAIKNIPEIVEAHLVFGAYDFVAKIEVDALDLLETTVFDKLRTLDGVVSTQTLLAQ